MIILAFSNDSKTGIYGLLGYRIRYSLSPEIHNHIFRKFGIKAVYGLFDVPQQDFSTAMDTLIQYASGFNVTTPYKENAAKLLQELSPEASLTGSVNLVKNNRGYNTDYLALQELISRQDLDLAGKECTIFGSGGAARTASYLFGNMKMYVTIINRSLEKAQKLENDLTRSGIDAQSVTLKTEISKETMESEVFVNCISYPEFMYPGMRSKLAVDFNYASRSGNFRNRFTGETAFITGEDILASQAIHSQRIWNNIEAEFTEILEVIDVKHSR